MRFLVAYTHDNQASSLNQTEAGPAVTSTEMGRDLCFRDAELEARWQLHCCVSLQGLDFSALLLCGTLQLLSLRRQWNHANKPLRLLLLSSAAASLVAAWCCQARPAAYRRRRREYLAACKLSVLLATAVAAATQTSLLPRTATRYWHVVMFAVLYGRGLFLGMATLFVQSGLLYEALVTFITLPVFVGEVHIMCRDRAIRGMLPRKLFGNLAEVLSGVADSFPLPMPPSGRRMGGLAACMAVHAFTQVAAGMGALLLAYFLEYRARLHFAAQRARPAARGQAEGREVAAAEQAAQAQQLDLALQLGLGWLVLLSACWKACQAVDWAANASPLG
ncbi:hypothetical protein WJX81_008341 [Elliptochloris bilobata]|uniref:Uncharacterized protein n=1 Tax=Elliptochloris bilobata TaxID=381761 RepID=A0AAW1S0J2_9CHLO